MSEIVYDRAFYVLPEKIASEITEYAKEKETDMRIGNKVPDGYQFPKPNLAIDSGFLMIHMQGYCSSLHVPMEMKEGLIDLYETLIKLNLHDDEKDSAIVKLQRMIQSSESVRGVMVGYAEARENRGKRQEEIEPESAEPINDQWGVNADLRQDLEPESK